MKRKKKTHVRTVSNKRQRKSKGHTRQRQTKQKTQHNMCWTPNSFRKIVKAMSTNYYTITLSDHINIYS